MLTQGFGVPISLIPTRRRFLHVSAASLAAGVASTWGTTPVAGATTPARKVTPLSLDLINYVNDGLAEVFVRSLNGTAHAEHWNKAGRMCRLLAQHFRSTGAEQIIDKLIKLVPIASVQPVDPADENATLLARLRKFNPGISSSVLDLPALSADEISAGAEEVTRVGFFSFLQKNADALVLTAQAGGLAPVSYSPDQAAKSHSMVDAIYQPDMQGHAHLLHITQQCKARVPRDPCKALGANKPGNAAIKNWLSDFIGANPYCNDPDVASARTDLSQMTQQGGNGPNALTGASNAIAMMKGLGHC